VLEEKSKDVRVIVTAPDGMIRLGKPHDTSVAPSRFPVRSKKRATGDG
jgi:hypothetical protein